MGRQCVGVGYIQYAPAHTHCVCACIVFCIPVMSGCMPALRAAPAIEGISMSQGWERGPWQSSALSAID